MAKKILFSFLGTGNYQLVQYAFDDKVASPTELVQIAYFDLLEEDMHLKLLLTKGARERHWNNPDPKNGLNMKAMLEERGISYETIDIPDGNDEKEHWLIFDQIVNNMDEGDKVIYDITHSFRSIPVIVLSAVNYLQYTKGIELEAIYYGAYEARKEGIAPILDLTFFTEMNSWAYACKQFLETGQSQDMAGMIRSALLKKVEKLKNPGPEQILNRLQNDLKHFSNALSVVRTTETINYGNSIKEKLQTLKDEDLSAVEGMGPFVSILDRVEDLFLRLRGNPDKTYQDVNVITEICIEFDLLQQALTMMNENVITMVMEYLPATFGLKKQRIDHRDIVSAALFCAFSSYEPQIRACDLDQCYTVIDWLESEAFLSRKDLEDLVKRDRNIRNHRNDINHAGYNANPSNYRKIQRFAQESMDAMKTFQAKLEPNSIEFEKKFAQIQNYKCFTHTDCEYFPCHSGVDPEAFNCLFCYCPLYFLGEACGGDFIILENGTKDCSACLYPHRPENYDDLLARLELGRLDKQSK